MMKKTQKEKIIPIIFTLSSLFILFTSVIFLMNHVKNLLSSDVSITLSEIVTQNKDVIASKLSLEINNLNLNASQVEEYIDKSPDQSDEALKEIYKEYLTSKENPQLFIVDDKGMGIFTSGQELDVSGRSYYRIAMEGNTNISDRVVSRMDGQDVFIISVPIEIGGKPVATMQSMYTPQDMYNICKLSLFSAQGNMYIINNQGYILITSQQDCYTLESDNFFRMIYSENPAAAKKLQEDIQNERPGFLETIVNGEEVFSAYTPIDDVYDWFLITSISSNAVYSNTNVVIKIFYVILGIVAIIFTMLLGFLWNNRKKSQEKLEKIAFEDAVTKGKTYNKFIMDVKNALNKDYEKSYHLLMMDIDNFKYINNFYGFEAGDRVLNAIDRVLAERLQPNESIARIYNDHFALLIENAEPERIYKLLDSASELEGIKIYLNAGLYKITNPDENVRIMVDKAGMAAQSVKNIRYQRLGLYSDKFDQQMIHNEQLKRSIEEALVNDEFIPFFQPKTDINTRKLYGAEALARWITKEGKLVSPGEFIPICENTGLIVYVDMLIFEKTLKFIRRNLDQGIKCVPISVNFSKLHLNDENFVKRIVEKLREYNVPPQLLELELTETAMFENYDTISRFIEQVHQYDLSISMDDFGSGYSSLNMLKNINIDVLKVDGAFLRDTTQDEKQKIIFGTIINMAQQLGISVVVEGVETIDNVELMQNCGCNIAQGYYYSKPLATDSFEKIYQEGIL